MGRAHVLIATSDEGLARRLHRAVWGGGHVAAYAGRWDELARALEKGPEPNLLLLDPSLLRDAPRGGVALLEGRRLALLGGGEVPGELTAAPRIEEGLPEIGLRGELSRLLPEKAG